jgi:Ribbon-helix-helix protein, copG family
VKDRDAGLTRGGRETYGGLMRNVMKTTVYLVEADYRRLKAVARQQKRPAAELIRQAVSDYARRRVRRSRSGS